MSVRPRTVRGRLRRLALIPLMAIGLTFGLVGAPSAQAAVLFGQDISWPQCPSTFPPTTTQFLVIGLTHGLPFTENPCVATQVGWATEHATPTHAYTFAAFPTTAQLTTHGSSGPWSSSTRAGRLSNVGYAEAMYAVATVRGVPGWTPRMVWIDVEPRTAQPWPSATSAQRRDNRLVIEGLMRGLRTAGFSYGVYSNSSGWQSITGSWRLPGVPVWATAGLLDYPNEALDRCTQPSFSGGKVYLAQWWLDNTRDFDRTCEPYAFTRLPMPPASLSNSTADFNGDWRNDILARWASSASLRLYPGTGTGSHDPSVQVSTGWSAFDVLETVGDFSGDGALDVLARESATGNLWMYRGNGNGGWRLPRVLVGTGWAIMNAVVGAGDFNGDGTMDVVARRASSGALYLYPGNGTGGWKPRTTIGTDWNRFSAVVAPGDVTGDGQADLFARERSTGILWLYPGTGTGTLATRVQAGSGWNGMTAIMSPGDFNGDRTSDLLARDPSGNLWLYGRTATNMWKPRVLVSTGWTIVNAVF